MSQRSRFFDSSGGDRIYDSSAWAQVVGGLTGDGVVYGAGGELAVSESSPPAMSVQVALGKAFVQGYYFEVYAAAESLVITDADPANPRIDRVVVRRNLTGRTASLVVIAGTPAASPSAPALTQNVTGNWDIPLAQVLVPALAASITDARITDERGTRAQGPDLGTVTDTSTGHRHEGTTGTGRQVRHADLASVSADQHHDQSHAHNGSDGSGTVAYGSVTGKPSTFAPTVHDHGSAGAGGNVPWGSVSGKPSTFAPTVHDHSTSGEGGNVPWGSVSGKPSSFTPAAHVIDSSGPHSGSGLTAGHVLRATSASAFSFGQLQHSQLGGVGDNDHHAQSHAHNGADGSGTVAYSAITGKPSAFAPSAHDHGSAGAGGTLSHDDLTGVSADDHHAKAHAHNGSDGSGTVAWSSVSGKPATFAPSAHASSHGTGGGDAITPQVIGAWQIRDSGTPGAGTRIFVGASTPSGTIEDGDVWIKG